MVGWLVAANKVFWLKELPQIPCRGRNCQLGVDEGEEGERGGEGKEGGGEGRRIGGEYQIVLVARPQIPLQREITGVMMILRRKRCMMWNTDQMRMTMNIDLEYLNVLTEELIAQVD